MAEVAKPIEGRLQNRSNSYRIELSFADCLTISDKFEAHGLGILIEELMSPAEILECHQKALEDSPLSAQARCRGAGEESPTPPRDTTCGRR